MKTLYTEQLAEFAGPIVVKEVRQALRARAFGVFFGLLLTACFLLALIVWSSGNRRAMNGEEAFALFLGALGVVCFFVIPFLAFRSMMKELEDETWVLLQLTGLRALPIVRGKWLSASSQALLYASACAPFVLFSYFLNGVDLLQLAAALLLTGMWTALLSSVCVAIATQAVTKLARTLAHFVTLGVLVFGTAAGLAFGTFLADEGQRFLSSAGGRWIVFTMLLSGSLLTWLTLETAAAGLASPTEAASRRARFALFVVTLLSLVTGAVIFIMQKGTGNDAAAGQVMVCFFLTVAGVVALSERDGYSAQLRGLRFKPGVLRSFWLVTLLLALSTVTWLVLTKTGSFGKERVYGLLATALYPLLYLSLAVMVARLTPLRRLRPGPAMWCAFVSVTGLGIALSSVVSLLADGTVDSETWSTFNPVMGLIAFLQYGNSYRMTGQLILLGAATLLFGFLAAFTLYVRDEART